MRSLFTDKHFFIEYLDRSLLKFEQYYARIFSLFCEV